MSESASIIGRWRITEMDNWDQEAITTWSSPASSSSVRTASAASGFIVVTGDLDCRDADRDGQPGAEFSWQGSDEGDDVSGRGLGRAQPRRHAEGHIYFHLGDDSGFRAERFNKAVG